MAYEEDSIDIEIVEVFIEECDEVLTTIKQFLPQWVKNPNHEHALKEIRRAFHTLKGSGRIVRAEEIGELAWSVETVLNKVLKGEPIAPDHVADLVEDVVALMPQLMACFSDGTPIPAKAAELKARADQLIKPQLITSKPINTELIETALTQVTATTTDDTRSMPESILTEESQNLINEDEVRLPQNSPNEAAAAADISKTQNHNITLVSSQLPPTGQHDSPANPDINALLEPLLNKSEFLEESISDVHMQFQETKEQLKETQFNVQQLKTAVEAIDIEVKQSDIDQKLSQLAQTCDQLDQKFAQIADSLDGHVNEARMKAEIEQSRMEFDSLQSLTLNTLTDQIKKLSRRMVALFFISLIGAAGIHFLL